MDSTYIMAVAVVAVGTCTCVEVFDEAIFSQIPYSYTSTSIPSNKAGGLTWRILLHQQYREDFNFSIVLPGAENFTPRSLTRIYLQ